MPSGLGLKYASLLLNKPVDADSPKNHHRCFTWRAGQQEDLRRKRDRQENQWLFGTQPSNRFLIKAALDLMLLCKAFCHLSFLLSRRKDATRMQFDHNVWCNCLLARLYIYRMHLSPSNDLWLSSSSCLLSLESSPPSAKSCVLIQIFFIFKLIFTTNKRTMMKLTLTSSWRKN